MQSSLRRRARCSFPWRRRRHRIGRVGCRPVRFATRALASRRKPLPSYFGRLPRRTCRPRGNTADGLGLSICSRLVAAMGGDIVATSAPGVGTTMHFGVVLDPAPAPVGITADTHPAGIRSLIVDDHPVNLRILRAQLESVGVDVLSAASAEDGLMRWDAATRGRIADPSRHPGSPAAGARRCLAGCRNPAARCSEKVPDRAARIARRAAAPRYSSCLRSNHHEARQSGMQSSGWCAS